MPSKVILIVIKFMFLSINMFWALLTGFSGSFHESESGPNIFMPANINCIVILTAANINGVIIILSNFANSNNVV